MSIYATLGSLRFPKDGYDHLFSTEEDWIEVTFQGVPPHIGHPSEYENGDPYAEFLPPAFTTKEELDGDLMRAVVFVTEDCDKGTERSGQEYVDPLFVITGKEYREARFVDLVYRICVELGEALQENERT